MGMLENVNKGKIKLPILALIYGPDGVGKTTWAANAPNPIILGKEKGSANMDVARFPEPKNLADVMLAVHELTVSGHKYETLAIDSLDWIEPMVWDHLCTVNSWRNIEDPGYGKGYALANQTWLTMISALSKLREERKMNIILIAHSQVKQFNDPSQPAPYDRYELKLNAKAAALWREFVDFVGFATYEVYTKTSKDGQRAKAFGDGKRVLYTERRPSYDAKNRLGLPSEIALSFSEFQKACEGASPNELATIMSDIKDLTGLVKDDITKKAVMSAVEDAKEDLSKLNQILNRLRVITQ